MDRRKLTDDLEVSVLGLGTVKLGRNRGVKYPDPFEIPNDNDAHKLLCTARDLGVNLIDTAPAYGGAEDRVGRLLQQVGGDWVVSTKVGEEWNPGGSRWDFTRTYTRMSVERSLRRLRREVLDLVLVHACDPDVEVAQQGCLGELARLHQEGKVRAVGFSARTPEGAAMALEYGVDVLMLEYGPHEERMAGTINLAESRGAGVMAIKSLAQGHVGKVQEAFDGYACHPMAAAIRYVLSRHGVTTCVVGTVNPEHLRENVEAMRPI